MATYGPGVIEQLIWLFQVTPEQTCQVYRLKVDLYQYIWARCSLNSAENRVRVL